MLIRLTDAGMARRKHASRCHDSGSNDLSCTSRILPRPAACSPYSTAATDTDGLEALGHNGYETRPSRNRVRDPHGDRGGRRGGAIRGAAGHGVLRIPGPHPGKALCEHARHVAQQPRVPAQTPSEREHDVGQRLGAVELPGVQRRDHVEQRAYEKHGPRRRAQGNEGGVGLRAGRVSGGCNVQFVHVPRLMVKLDVEEPKRLYRLTFKGRILNFWKLYYVEGSPWGAWNKVVCEELYNTTK